ncbi:hypothetical protein D3C72_997840 [compost metagenome]
MLLLSERQGFCGFALTLVYQRFQLSAQQQSLFFKPFHFGVQFIAATLVSANLQRLIMRHGRMFGCTAQRAGFTRLEAGAVRLQTLDQRFLFAQGFQIQIVLVFLFVLLASRSQGLIKRGLRGQVFFLRCPHL